MKICPFCSEEIKKEAVKCKHCKEFLEDNSKNKCTDCGNLLEDGGSFCEPCWMAQSTTRASTPHKPVKNKSLAVFLAFFLGIIGAHKFYLNMPGWGVVYAIFCWSGIPLVLGVLEAISYLSMPDDMFQERYV